VLAGQTDGDEKGEYQPDMAAQVGVVLRRIIKLLAEAGAGPEHIVRLRYRRPKFPLWQRLWQQDANFADQLS
jgi:enamine deaminase RidA (YjgF/YER057c/UK114 family)